MALLITKPNDWPPGSVKLIDESGIQPLYGEFNKNLTLWNCNESTSECYQKSRDDQSIEHSWDKHKSMKEDCG